jgi:hypothetical protein
MDNDEDGEFERVEPIVRVEEKLRQQGHRHGHHGGTQEEHEEEDTHRPSWDFLQANPILPPGKYQFKEEPRLQLRGSSGRNKLIRTTIAASSLPSSPSKSFNEPKNISFSLSKKKEVQTPEEVE